MITHRSPVITSADELNRLEEGTLARLAQAVAGAPALCVARLGGELHALADRCPHRGAPLSTGILDGTEVVCRAHGLRFDLRTGLSSDGRSAPATPYAVTVQDGIAASRRRNGHLRLLSIIRRSVRAVMPQPDAVRRETVRRVPNLGSRGAA
jgi:nitrite reductase/ring-hydroxylating ferredoxin subunit